MDLSSVEKSLIVAAYFRGGNQNDVCWTSNSDQIVTLSLFYTGDITGEDCVLRFQYRNYIQNLYDSDGILREEIAFRYRNLINLLTQHPDLVKGGGDFEQPADPTFTACRLTQRGRQLAIDFVTEFPTKPDFPNWADKRSVSTDHFW